MSGVGPTLSPTASEPARANGGPASLNSAGGGGVASGPFSGAANGVRGLVYLRAPAGQGLADLVVVTGADGAHGVYPVSAAQLAGLVADGAAFLRGRWPKGAR